MNRFVLIVDDDQAIRETLCEVLEDEGHRALGASNGEEALELLRTDDRPCVILLDVMMPVMDGIAFRTHQLRNPELSSIPVAVITAGGKGAAASINAEAVLPKPLRIQTVLDTIERLCAS